MQYHLVSDFNTGPSILHTSAIWKVLNAFPYPLGTVRPRIRGLLEKYPTFGREKETGLLGALDT